MTRFLLFLIAIICGSVPGVVAQDRPVENHAAQGLTAFEKGDLLLAEEIWQAGRKANDPASIFNLAQLYRTRFPGSDKVKQVDSLIQEAAELGHPIAAYWYATENSLDPVQKDTFLEVAAIAGHPTAAVALVQRLWNDRSGRQEEAAAWLVIAAELGFYDVLEAVPIMKNSNPGIFAIAMEKAAALRSRMPKDWAVQLASVIDYGRVTMAQDTLEGQSGKLSIRGSVSPNGKTRYRLIELRDYSRQSALSHCEELKSQGTDCFVTRVLRPVSYRLQ